MSARSRDRAERGERREVAAGQHRPGRVVRADHEDRARPRRDGRLDGVRVDRPGAVVLERVRPDVDQLEPREVLEQRVARHRHQHLVAGVAEELEEERVGLARAGREDHARRVDRSAGGVDPLGDRLAGARQAERMRVVAQPRRPAERGQRLGRIREADPGRVRFRQIDESDAARPDRLFGAGQSIRGEVGRDARREHPCIR